MISRLIILITLILTTCFILPSSAAEPSDPNRYLNAVRTFADNVLKYGRDTYGPKHTPLFVDGLMVRDPNNPDYGKDGVFKPVEWIDPDGTRWILSNLASQQNLFRTLAGLTAITGDPKYKQAAMDAIKYAFENLRTPNGLLHWGGHQAYDVGADRPHGRNTHELKSFYPYYDLMWEVDPKVTKQLIEAIWSGHILDWSNLSSNRHASSMTKLLDKPWDHQYKEGPVFVRSTGTCDILCGSDLYYAAAWLTKMTGDKEPLLWSQRLADRFVQTRNPKTGLGTCQFCANEWADDVHFGDEVINDKLGPSLETFPHRGMCNNGKRTVNSGYVFPTPGAAAMDWYHIPSLCQLMLGDLLGKNGKEFTQWAVEDLTARGKVAYRKSDNVYIPVLLDGTSLEGYVCKENGPLGVKGTFLELTPLGTGAFWAYSLAYCLTGNEFMWEMARNIAMGNNYGDLGTRGTEEPNLNLQTNVSDPYAIVVFLELYKKTGKKPYLEMARRIGENVLSGRFYKGFFVSSHSHVYTKFDAIDSLALLHLHAALVGALDDRLPKVWAATSFLELPYRKKDNAIDNQIIYTLTDSPDVPLSLQEAAAMGNLDLAKSLLSQGADIDGFEGTYAWTALQFASAGGHIDIVRLLLTKGAQVDVIGGLTGTALHHAAERGHRQVVELLIDHGADIDTKSVYGRTSLDVAFERNHNDIVDLLLANGAEVSSIHMAAYVGDLSKVKAFLKKGIDVNTRGPRRQTALHIAASEGHKQIVELLLEQGADVNAGMTLNRSAAEQAMDNNHSDIVELLIAKGADISPLHFAIYLKDEAKAKSLIEDGADLNKRTPYGTTPLGRAVNAGFRDLARLLLDRGADVNAKDNWDWTPLHYAAYENREMAELLIDRGADVNTKDGDDKTPLWYAQKHGRTEIVELLKKRGAKE